MRADGLLLNSGKYENKDGQVKYSYDVLVGDKQSNGAIKGARMGKVICDQDKLAGVPFMSELLVTLELSEFYDTVTKKKVLEPKYTDVQSLYKSK